MQKRPTPILSSRADDPQLRHQIDEFVIRLAERVDAVQDALCSGDLALLKSRCSLLSQDAARLGYSSLADAARSAATASAEDKAELAEDAIVAITQLSQRIRLGYRGAA
jgi:hypothetical protein